MFCAEDEVVASSSYKNGRRLAEEDKSEAISILEIEVDVSEPRK